MKKSIWLFAAACLCLFACSKDEDTPAGDAYIRVIHGVPNEGSLQVDMNGNRVATIGSYSLSSTYTKVTAGNVKVKVTGTTTLLDVNYQAEKNKYYTVVIADSTNKLKFSYLTDDPIPASGKAKINILHLGTIAPTTSFSSAAATGDISSNRFFNDQLSLSSAASYMNVTPGSYTVEARTPSTTGATGIIVTNTKNLEAGKSYTFVYRNPIAPSTTPTITFISN